MTSQRRIVVVEGEDDLDAMTVLGGVPSVGQLLGVCVAVRGGRSLPVSVRELTTLEHLFGPSLAVLLDSTGCTPAEVQEALQILRLMAKQEVTSTSGPTWVLSEAPNRPLPLARAFNVFLFARTNSDVVEQLGHELEIPVVVAGESGVVGEVWEYYSARDLAANMEAILHATAP